MKVIEDKVTVYPPHSICGQGSVVRGVAGISAMKSDFAPWFQETSCGLPVFLKSPKT